MVKNLQMAIFEARDTAGPGDLKGLYFQSPVTSLTIPSCLRHSKKSFFKAPKMAEILEFLGHFVDLQVIFEEAKRNSIPSPGPLQPNGNSAGGIAGGGGT